MQDIRFELVIVLGMVVFQLRMDNQLVGYINLNWVFMRGLVPIL